MMDYKKRSWVHSKFWVLIFFNTITLAYGGDTYLENITAINWITTFVFILLLLLIILKIYFNTTKAIKRTFVIFILLFISGEIESWHKSYIPTIGYYKQFSYEYGEYVEDTQVKYLIDENITNIFNDGNLIIKTDVNIYLISYDIRYKTYSNIEDFHFKYLDKLKIKKLSSYHMVYLDNIFLLNDNNKTINAYTNSWDRKRKRYFFTKIDEKIGNKIETYLDRNGEDYNLTKRLIYGKQNKLFTDNYDCNSTGYSGIVMNKKEKSFYLCKEKKRYQTTHLKYTPKIAIYMIDNDTVLIAYEEKKGLFILKNKYTKIYKEIQNSVTRLLKILNQPKWNKPDLSKINLEQNKLKKLIDIFTPYEKNQRHWVEYSVINYDGYQATVKANIDDKNTVLFNLKLEKGNWNIKEIE